MTFEPMRCWAEIELAALLHNARVARDKTGGSAGLLAVVKANAYGHGLAGVVKALADEAESFGVANLEEAIAVREAAPDRPVMIFGPALPSERREIVDRGFIASVSCVEEAEAFASPGSTVPARLNLVVDTGMGRMGCREDGAVVFLHQVFNLANVEVHSVSTHLPSADEDAAFTRKELSSFEQLIGRMRAVVPGDYQVHALPSAGVLGFGDSAFDFVRAGLMLYGVSSIPECQALLRPALTLKSSVVLVRDMPAGASISYGRTFITPGAMRVATIGIGYADGFQRALSNQGASVLIHGRRCPLLGRVTMDMIIVDVSHVPNLAAGDEVVLIGRQGNDEILATELAARAGTIAWEIFTGIGTRVRRVYL